MPDIELVQELVNTIERAYEEGVFDINNQFGLTPPEAPTDGDAWLLKNRRLGIAMYRSLKSLNGRALTAELTAGLEGEHSGLVETRWFIDLAKGLTATGVGPIWMQLELIGDVVGDLRLRLDRADKLVELIRARPLTERASAYMQRSTRQYLAGFDEECVVMCACALEAAYEGRFEEQEMLRHMKGKEKQGRRIFDAWEYEKVALKLEIYSKQEYLLAKKLRDARNDIVHLKPDVYLRALEALSVCTTLLDRLFPQKDQPADDLLDFDSAN